VSRYSVAEVAARCGGHIVGDGELRLSGVRSLEAAGPGDLAFVADRRAGKKALASQAGAFLARSAEAFAGRTVIEVADPALAVVAALELFHPRREARPGIHPTAIVAPGALVDASAEIGPYAVVGDGTRVGPRAILESHVVVGRRCVLGEDAWLHPHVVLYDGVTLGARVEVHSGVVLGADGFGYVPGPKGAVKVPQIGTVTVEDDVEIGANSCVDRAALETTRIGAGTKVDDLVMVGHNCVVGKNGFLCGQAGLAGSTTVGDGVMLGGQVGSAGHLTIGNGVKAEAQSGIASDVPDGEVIHGSPAFDYREHHRSFVEFRRLPETARLVRALAEKAGLKKGEDG
jgi:UDP-3-O-[3-hydroxymyristoyl] glucosamine N-acyltransferase